MNNNQTCNECVFFKTLGSSYTRVCYLFKNKVSSVSPACKHFKINPINGFKNKRRYS